MSQVCSLEGLQSLNFENRIIQGNNHDVLRELQSELRSKVKCIYIDPPYNNGESYAHYEDNHEHSVWEEDIQKTLSLLKPLLREDGSIWISIDDGNVHHMRVIADRVFERKNYVTTIVWQHRTTRENRKLFSNNHEYILVYCINEKKFIKGSNRANPTQDMIDRYKSYDDDPRGPWQSVSANVQAGHAVASQFYSITSPSGKVHVPPKGRCWIYNETRMLEEIKKNNIWFGKTGSGVPRVKKFLDLESFKTSHETIWSADECGTNKSAKKHILKLFPNSDVFDTPKPEELIYKIFKITTNENDLILDCYLGSGTSVAVAHKMKRSYVGIEIGDHISELVVSRLNRVIDNKDPDGITSLVQWNGGGKFRYKKIDF